MPEAVFLNRRNSVGEGTGTTLEVGKRKVFRTVSGKNVVHFVIRTQGKDNFRIGKVSYEKVSDKDNS